MKYLHASLDCLDVGTVLKPREDYESHWSQTDFYSVLEKYRPSHMLSHKESVFMCSTVDDLDNCIGGDYIFEVVPDARVEKHDMNWSSQISCLVGDFAPEEEIKSVAEKYWNSVPYGDDPLWEYLTPHAAIKKVYEYDSYEEPNDTLVRMKLTQTNKNKM